MIAKHPTLTTPDWTGSITGRVATSSLVGNPLLALLALEVLLVGAYCVVHILLPHLPWGPVSRLLDVDDEVSIPTWFSSVQLFAIGLLAVFRAGTAGELRRTFLWLAAGFIFLSMDEAASLHEQIVDAAQRYEMAWLLFLTFRGDHKAWMVPYVVGGASTLFLCRRSAVLMWSTFPRSARCLVLGTVLFAAGGIGVELASFHFAEAGRHTGYLWAVAGEEYLEMVGATVMLHAFLRFERQRASHPLQSRS